MRNDRRGRVTTVPGYHHIDAVRCQYLDGCDVGGLGKRVCILAEKETACNRVRFAVVTDGLDGREYMIFVEA